MFATLAIQVAGIILLGIASANFFAPRKMRWIENLSHTEKVFQQVFIVHCVFLIGCVFAMALACIILPHRLLHEPMGQVILNFMAIFWSARVLVQVFYYEHSIKRKFPIYNILFTTAFLYLAGVFLFLSLTY